MSRLLARLTIMVLLLPMPSVNGHSLYILKIGKILIANLVGYRIKYGNTKGERQSDRQMLGQTHDDRPRVSRRRGCKALLHLVWNDV